MNIATVVEGPTDRLILKAIINHLYPGEHRYLDLQPSISATFGSTGTGWKGVRRWCEETWKRPGSSLVKLISADAGVPLDLLVIHVDADIARETDLQESWAEPIPVVTQPCPPIVATIQNLQQVIAHWLNYRQASDLPPSVILVIPAQDMENWVFAALFPHNPLCQEADYECFQTGRRWPGFLLTLAEYGPILRRRDGTPKKSPDAYKPRLTEIASAWSEVCRICSQADDFNQQLQARTQ